MKKLWKPMLSVLLSMCLIAGWLFLPASAANPITDAPAISDTLTLTFPDDFVETSPGSGTYIVSSDVFNTWLVPATTVGPIGMGQYIPALLDEPGLLPGSHGDFNISIVNDSGVEMDYTLEFWHGFSLYDRKAGAERTPLAYAEVMARGSFDPAFDKDYWDLFALGKHQIPPLFTLAGPSAGQSISGAIPCYKTQADKDAGRITNWKAFRTQGEGRNAVDLVSGGRDIVSGTIAPASGSKDEYDLLWSWPREQNPTELWGVTSYFAAPYNKSMFEPGWAWWAAPTRLYWDVIHNFFADFPVWYWEEYRNGDVRASCDICNGFSIAPCEGHNGYRPYQMSNPFYSAVEPYAIDGGLELAYWVKYEIIAEAEIPVPQATVKFAMDDAGAIPCSFGGVPSTFPNWTVDVGTTPAGKGGLPTPDAPANKVFVGWKYFDGTDWVAVGNNFPFSEAREYVFVAVFETLPEQDDCDIPWWPFALGGVGLLGAGGVAIAGMTLPWLVALPLLPILLLCGGKILSKEKPADCKEIIMPPKTGEDTTWALLPIAGIGLAGAWLVLLRRRREECEA